MPKKLTADELDARKAAEAARYVRQIGRQAQKGIEPNDRRYDREFDQKARRMDPVHFNALINGDE